MYKRLPYIVLFCFVAIFISRASLVAPSFLVRNYTIEDYKASCQNWAIAVSPCGRLYVANNSGLLTFDGNTWCVNALPDKSPVYQLTLRGDTIYTKGETTLGYWSYNAVHALEYHPIDSLPAYMKFPVPQPDYRIPDEIQAKHPTAFASAGGLHFTGTAMSGIYITDDTGDMVCHLDVSSQLPDNIVRFICVQDQSLIWVAFDNGISQIDINPPITMLGRRNQIGKLEEAVKVGERIYVRTNMGYFSRSLRFGDHFVSLSEEEGQTYIQPDTVYKHFSVASLFKDTERLGQFAQAEKVYPIPEDLYWLTLQNEAGLFHREGDAGVLKCRLLFDNYNFNLVTNGKQIIPLNDSLDMVSSMQGALLVNTRQLIAESLGELSMPCFTRLEYQDREGIHRLDPDTQSITLPYDFQELSLYVGTTVFTPNHQISYKLEGVSTDWSSWQREGKLTFLQLPEGSYLLRVRRYIIRGPFPEITMRITVRSPWYSTVWAYFAYVLLLGLILHGGFRYRLRNQRKKEKDVLERERRAEQQRMQQLKNEMLETELQNKSNELTLQTTALVKRNEATQALLEELDRQKETLGDRYPNKLYNRLRSLMESTLNDQADWVQFETYFNSAHQNFMDRLRQQYTDITAGDLRICCLLRMNLSTKEIASLLNVSVRAVELRRYRLRKRLSLDTDTNLVDFLMKF